MYQVQVPHASKSNLLLLKNLATVAYSKIQVPHALKSNLNLATTIHCHILGPGSSCIKYHGKK